MSRLFAPFFLFLILRSFASQRKSPNNVSTEGTKQNLCGRNWGGCCNGRDGRDGKDGRDGRDGIFGYGMKGEKGEQGIKGNEGMKGQKGESGSPGKNASRKIRFGDTAENCTRGIAGTVRYNTAQKTLQLCDGSAWLPLVTAGKGLTSNNPGRHCLDILNSGQSQGNGIYWIDPNGGSTADSFQAFCDMQTERGGWTLFATKVSPSFLFIKSAFSPVAAKTKNTDAASHIHPSMGDWDEIMFRFADVNTIRVIYNRKAGAPNVNKAEFDKFLMGKSMYRRKDMYGFYKYYTAQEIPKEIRKEGISPLKDCTSDQTLGSRKATSILTNGLTFGITWFHKESTISTLIAARHWAQSASRATVICTSQSG